MDKKLAAKGGTRIQKKRPNRDAIRFVNFTTNVPPGKGRVKLFTGWRVIPPVPSQLKGKLNATVSQAAGTGISPFRSSRRRLSNSPSGSMVGLDAGIAKLATLSDGTVFRAVNSFKTNQPSW